MHLTHSAVWGFPAIVGVARAGTFLPIQHLTVCTQWHSLLWMQPCLEHLLQAFGLLALTCLGNMFLTHSFDTQGVEESTSCFRLLIVWVNHQCQVLPPEFSSFAPPAAFWDGFGSNRSRVRNCNLILIIWTRHHWVNLMYTLSPSHSLMVIGLSFVRN